MKGSVRSRLINARSVPQATPFGHAELSADGWGSGAVEVYFAAVREYMLCAENAVNNKTLPSVSYVRKELESNPSLVSQARRRVSLWTP